VIWSLRQSHVGWDIEVWRFFIAVSTHAVVLWVVIL
jgi:hypothetical protein